MTLALILGIPGAILALVTLIGLVWRYWTTVKKYLSRQPWAKFDERRFPLFLPGIKRLNLPLPPQPPAWKLQRSLVPSREESH